MTLIYTHPAPAMWSAATTAPRLRHILRRRKKILIRGAKFFTRPPHTLHSKNPKNKERGGGGEKGIWLVNKNAPRARHILGEKKGANFSPTNQYLLSPPQ